jgi:hypothetical protein
MELKRELAKSYQIGFSCETTEDAVLYGLNLLSENLVLKDLKKICSNSK